MSSQQEPVGSLGVEAAKLLAALQDWAKDSGSEYAEAADAAATGAASALHDVGEHVATGSEECTYCPLCRAIAAVRGTSPEVRAHLRTAATSLIEAAAGLLATQAPTPEGAGHRGAPVEKIDLGDPGSDDEWEDHR